MDTARLARIQDLFLAALEHPAEARAGFLDAVCDDPALRKAVEVYLAADADEAAFFLDRPLVRLCEPETEPEAVEGRHVGPYRLRRLLGRGGMGAVYLAERTDVGLRVALKVVRGDLADPGARRRFAFERRVLARLEHPNIARLYDAGVGDDGTPYFAMELVKGVPLTDYCDRKRLDLDARLRLFERVGRTVQHAHQHFIVHRDLKPSNIFVTPEGEVKLLDFGIAKALNEAEDEADGLTATGRRLLTPAYAAPEQFRSGPVTAATDVYSLGVVLFELLTGKRPDTDSTHAPKRPSTAVTETDATGTETAAARQTTTERLARRLRGDLDVICLKALQPDPNRRYASAEAFVEDIQRHLAGLPVTARRDSVGYRLQKFVRRHRRGVLTSLAAATVLALVVGFYTIRLQAERDTARLEAQKAERLSLFLTDLFSRSDPYEEVRGDTLRARDLLARGTVRTESELSGEPEVQAAMFNSIGTVYARLGLPDEAQPLVKRALTIRRALLGPDHPDVAESLLSLGHVHLERGEYAATDSIGSAVLALLQRGGDEVDVARALHLLGLSQYEQGQFTTADSLHKQSYALFRNHLGADQDETVASLIALAHVEAALGVDSTAAAYTADVLAARRRTLGDGHPLVAEALSDYGYTLRRQGRYEDAERAYREALALKRRALGDDHPSVATTLNNLGVLLGVAGRYDEVAPILEEALAIRRARYGDVHPLVASSINNLAQLAVATGDLDAAFGYQQEALELALRLYDGDHPDIAQSLQKQALIRFRQGRFREAEGLFREVLAMQRRLRGGDHELVAQNLNNVGSALIEQARHAEAEPLLHEALAMYRRTLGEAHVELAVPLRHLGRIQTARGHYEEAERLLNEALQLESAHLSPEHPRVRLTRDALAALYEAWDRPDMTARYGVSE
jgi:serine/threonine protein kinase/tetratricopeptide (TPR) repeat protein